MPRLSLARQLLLLQLAVVLVAVGATGGFAIWSSFDRATEEQRARVLAAAQTLASSSEAREALATADPSATLQPLALRVQRSAQLSFVVFMSPKGIRYSHPEPARIGSRFVGTIAPAAAGRAFTEEYRGTLGPSIRAVAPIRGTGGAVVGLVAVGVLQEKITAQVRHQLPGLIASLVLALALGAGLSGLVARRVRRQTRGLDPDELAVLYDHHDAVLHAIREGIVVVDAGGRVRLVNAEARRLLGLDESAVGQPLEAVVRDPGLQATLRGEGDSAGGGGGAGATHVVGGRVLLTGASTAEQAGTRPATVTTLRDRTELESLVRELATVKGLADALRAQAHESANELHTVVGLVELGRHEDAIAFATRRIQVTQDEVDVIQQHVGDPALAALMLAKAATCREHGVQLVVDERSALDEGLLTAEDLVTIVGNLIDNALDALSGRSGGKARRGGRIAVWLQTLPGEVRIEVRDDGAGVPVEDLPHLFEPGWSTKPGRAPAGRGLGLALVAAVAERLGGTARARNDGGAVFEVTVPTGKITA